MKQFLLALLLFVFCPSLGSWVHAKNDDPKDHPPLSAKLPIRPVAVRSFPKPAPRKSTTPVKGYIPLSSFFIKPTSGSVDEPRSGSAIGPLPRPRPLPVQKPLGPDPIRFRMQANRDSVDIGEEFEITITAELLPILPGQLFFFESQRSYSLKLVMPEGYSQTGGTYYDLVNGTLPADGVSNVSYSLRGKMMQPSKGCFRLLRGDISTTDQSLFIDKGVLCLPVKNNLDKSISTSPIDSLRSVPQARLQASSSSCNAPAIGWAGNFSIKGFTICMDQTSGTANATLQVNGCNGSTINWYRKTNNGPSELISSGATSTTYLSASAYQPNTVTYYYFASCACSGGGESPSSNNYTAQLNQCSCPPINPISINAGATAVCPGQTTTLTVNGCNGTIYWSDNTNLHDNPRLVGIGTYTAYCTNACSQTSQQITIATQSSANPNFTINAAATAVCPGQTTTLTVSGCNGSVSWANGLNPNAAGTGTHTAYCTTSCSQTTQQITIATQSSANPISLNAGATAVCPGQTTTLTVSGCNGSVSWANGINPNAVGPGTYTAYCTSSCSQTSQQITIATQSSANPISLNAGATAVCPGQTTTLTVSGCNGSVSWANGLNPNAVGPGTYTAYCTSSCSQTTQQITIATQSSANPISINAGATAVCPGQTTTLTVNGCNGTIYWSDNTNLHDNPRLVGIGTYTANCQAVCSTSQATATIQSGTFPIDTYVRVSQDPAIGFTTARSFTLCPGGYLALGVDNNRSGQGYHQRWQLPDGSFTGDNQNLVIGGGAQGGTYHFLVTDPNGCSNVADVVVSLRTPPLGGHLCAGEPGPCHRLHHSPQFLPVPRQLSGPGHRQQPAWPGLPPALAIARWHPDT